MKITFVAIENFGSNMAGPGIRISYLAHELSQRHTVTVVTPNQSDIQDVPFEVVKMPRHDGLAKLIASTDVVVSQVALPEVIEACKSHDTRFVLDAYDPEIFETLEIFSHDSMEQQHKAVNHVYNQLTDGYMVADGVVCASERQRNLWLGTMLALGWVTPENYQLDPTFYSYIQTVPFGVPADKPTKSGPGMRDQFGFAKDDIVLLWGGGIWNWLDPVTPIKAIDLLKSKYKNIRLVFLTTQNPSRTATPQTKLTEALALATKLELVNKHVFFNQEKVEYLDRQNFLLDADISVSAHENHLETQFAFRTRMLDSFWCELPVVCSAGDVLSEVVEKYGIGEVAPAGNAQAFADAVAKVIQTKGPRDFVEVKQHYSWQNSAIKLEELLEKTCQRPMRPLNTREKIEYSRWTRKLKHVLANLNKK